MLRDPLAAKLMERGTYHGIKGIGDSICPITPDERDRIVKRLELDAKDMICDACGSTKPMIYFKSIGALGCCPDRHMVPAGDVIAERDLLRAAAPMTAADEAVAMTFGPPCPPFRQHVRGEAVSARIAKNTSQTGLRLFVNLTKKLATALPGTRVDVRVGTGDDQDKTLLAFGNQGAFHVCRQRGQKTFLILPIPPAVGKPKTLPATPCHHVWRVPGSELVVTLPLAEWAKSA